MKRAFVLLIFLLIPCAVQAQTTGTAVWTQTEAPAIVAKYTYKLANSAVPSSVTTPVTLTPTCSAQGTGTACTATVPATLMAKGTFTLSVTDGFSTAASTFTPGTVNNPGGFTITVTTTTTVTIVPATP